MGDIGGVDLVSRAHAMTSTPLLVLMPAKSAVTPGEILDAGADDSLGEPFLLEELAVRTRRLLHRAGVCLGPLMLKTGLGQLEINSLERSVRLDGKSLMLTRKGSICLRHWPRPKGCIVPQMIPDARWRDLARSTRRRVKNLGI
jgi:DNA-binding response OmpR family regulator